MASTHTIVKVGLGAERAAQAGQIYAGAVSAPAARLAKDMNFGGAGTVYGVVEEKGALINAALRRRVVLISERTRQAIRETWSDRATGSYSFHDIDATKKYTALAYDYEHNYRAVAADNLIAEVLP